MKILTKALGLFFTVFITQKSDKHDTTHTKIILIVRKGKIFVTKIVTKSICDITITIANRIVAERKNRFTS